jgi:hypothetical protein
MSLVRKFNWATLLAKIVEARRETAFRWGKQDCCLFAADVVQELTGEDLAAEWRGKYRTATGAERVLRPLGGINGLMDQLAARHGLARLESAFLAQRGDVVVLDVPPADKRADKRVCGPALGICIGQKAAGAGPNGLVFVPIAQCRRAWRVG